MQYSYVAAALLAITSSVFAQTAGFAVLTVPSQDQNVAAGSVLDIVWAPSTGENAGPITIQLLQGATPATLEIGQTVAANIDQATGKFAWTVPKDLKSFATYGFKLSLDSKPSVFQFSFPFHVTGLGSSPSSSASGYSTGGTTTVHLSTGSGYTAKPTISSYIASSTSVNSTSIYVSSTYVSSTHSSSASASAYGSGSVVYPTANMTLSTTFHPTIPSTRTGSSASSTGSSPASVTGNSASTIARGGFAVAAGMVIALAL